MTSGVSDADYDVAVVGAGLAGCTAAILLGRYGLSVALLETHRDASTYKRLCTTAIHSSALPTLQRLGLDTEIEAAGGRRNHEDMWCSSGRLRDPGPGTRPPHGYNTSREILDPMIRRLAAATPGVDLILGSKVHELEHDSYGRISGVVAGDRHIGCRLVIGADGYASKVAELAGLPGIEVPNRRFSYFARFRNVGNTEGHSLRGWWLARDAAVAADMSDGTTLLGAVPDRAKYDEFVVDKEASIRRMFEGLPDGPILTDAVRVSDVIGCRDYPSIARPRIASPGVALVGDAAMVIDPLQAAGCGYAFRTAEWLADLVAEPLSEGDGSAVDRAAAQYQWVHRRRVLPIQAMGIALSRLRTIPLLTRLSIEASEQDPRLAETLISIVTHNATPLSALSPMVPLRTIRGVIRSRRSRP